MELDEDDMFEFTVKVDGEVFTLIAGSFIDDPNAPGQKAVQISDTSASPESLRSKGYGNIAYTQLSQWAKDHGMSNVYSDHIVDPSAGRVYGSLGKRGAYQHTQNPDAVQTPGAYGPDGKLRHKLTADEPVHRLDISNVPQTGDQQKPGLDYDSEGNPVSKTPTRTRAR
jgi:hypothetical protein